MKPPRNDNPRQGFSKIRSKLAWAMVVLLAPILQVIAGAPRWVEWDRVAIVRGQVWRMVLGQWVHWSNEHLLWSGGAFAVLVISAVRMRVRGILLCIVLSAIVCGAALFVTDLQRVRGLSGIDSGLFLLVCLNWLRDGIAGRERWRAVAAGGLLIGFVGKIAYELIWRRTMFAGMDAGLVIVPSMHAAGGVVGAVVFFISGLQLPIRFDFRKMLAAGGICPQPRWSLKMRRIWRI